MKKYFHILHFVWLQTVSGQISNAKIVYNVIPYDEEIKETLISSYFEDAKKDLQDVDILLLCHGNESFFFTEKKMDTPKSNFPLSLQLAGIKGRFYTNLSKKITLEERSAYGDEFVIRYEQSDLQWKLTNEKKQIGNYTCYKATSIYNVKNSKGEFTFPVIAWYAPDINLNFGPKNYNGLPGLIMELTERSTTFYFKSLKLRSLTEKEFKLIKKPDDARAISKKEFEDIGMDIGRNIYNRN